MVIALIAVNVLIFAANLYISNHCWTPVDLPTFMTLLRDGNLDTLWMPKGFLTFSELIWDVSGIFGSAIATLIRAAVTGKVICVVGASGAIFGLLGGLLAPVLYMLFRVKSTGGRIGKEGKMAILESIFFTIMMVLPGFFEENVSWEGHIGGLIAGLIAGLIMFAMRERKESVE